VLFLTYKTVLQEHGWTQEVFQVRHLSMMSPKSIHVLCHRNNVL
jgi:hypothetical protein